MATCVEKLPNQRHRGYSGIESAGPCKAIRTKRAGSRMPNANRCRVKGRTVASMVCLDGIATAGTTRRGQEYEGGARRGATLNTHACRVGRHCLRTYTTAPGCSLRNGLQRTASALNQRHTRKHEQPAARHHRNGEPENNAATWNRVIGSAVAARPLRLAGGRHSRSIFQIRIVREDKHTLPTSRMWE